MAAPPAASSTRSRPPPVDDVEAALYEKRQKIYPREVHGWFATMRVTGAVTLLGLFYGVCWLRWDERQLLLFDLPARKFNVFWWTFYPQDFLYLALLLILAALALFFFTSLAGRLWCGYACPQTVYTEVFLWIERKIEGDRPRQMKLDRAPWSARKIALKSAKHGVWIAFSLWTGFTFVGYFTPVTELGGALLRLRTGPWETFRVLFYGFATYGNAGWLREQVCIYMCPIVNMHDEPLRWRVGASGIEGLRLDVDDPDRVVAPGEVASVPVRLDAPRDSLRTGSTPVRFTVEAIEAVEIRTSEETRFLGPAQGQ